MADFVFVAHSVDMQDKKPPTNFIRRVREQKRMTREWLASRVGTSASQITKLERGERKLTQEWIERLAVALDTPPISLIAPWSTEVIGITNEHGEIIYKEKGGVPTIEAVDLPSEAPATTVAAQVGRNGLPGFAEHGSILLFDWNPSESPKDIIGKMAVVWPRFGPTDSDKNRRAFVRRIFPSSADDRWTLVSPTGVIENDIELVQAIRIQWLKLP